MKRQKLEEEEKSLFLVELEEQAVDLRERLTRLKQRVKKLENDVLDSDFGTNTRFQLELATLQVRKATLELGFVAELIKMEKHGEQSSSKSELLRLQVELSRTEIALLEWSREVALASAKGDQAHLEFVKEREKFATEERNRAAAAVVTKEDKNQGTL